MGWFTTVLLVRVVLVAGISVAAATIAHPAVGDIAVCKPPVEAVVRTTTEDRKPNEIRTAGLDCVVCVPICLLDPTGVACITCLAVCPATPI